MELFPDGHHVRLRSRGRDGMYLHAAEDGVGVYLSKHRASLHAAWQVHLVERDDDTFLLLHGAAYGRYLAATDDPAPPGHLGLRVVQGAYDDGDEDAVAWIPEKVATTADDENDVVLLRHVAANRLLRANGKYCWWRTGVSVDDDLTRVAMMHWVVEPIPPRSSSPPIPYPTPVARRRGIWNSFICGICLAAAPVVERRMIRFVQAADDGSFDPNRGWRVIEFHGRSVFRLWLAVAREVNQGSIIGLKLSVRAGNLGRLTPLVVDLPRNEDPIDCVILSTWTPTFEFRYPDVDERGAEIDETMQQRF